MTGFRRKWAASAATAAAFSLALGGPIAAQQRPSDFNQLPPVPTSYTPKKLPWGDYDFTGTWPVERLREGNILFQRPPQYGNRIWVTDEEFGRRLEAARKSDGNYTAEPEKGVDTPGTEGLEDWFKTADIGKRTSLLVSPADGQLPPLTANGDRLFKAGRSGWVPGQNYDFVDDFDTWDRCITRGFPASMYPNRYNGGIRLFQSPGYIVIQLEMLGTRVIPIVAKDQAHDHWPRPVEAWMGNSRAWWEGKTLTIETTNIVSGDAVTHGTSGRSAAPVIVTMMGGAPLNTIPMSKEARTIERLTMTGPNAMVHELTYEDPKVFTAPWTTRMEWTRDESYQFFEYACHEGNVQIRNYIKASRAHRADVAVGKESEITPETDDRSRFLKQFDWDPGVGPRPVPAAPAAAKDASGA